MHNTSIEKHSGGERDTTEKLNFPPVIVVLAGLPRTGKNTLAQVLVQKTNLIYLDVDDARYNGEPPEALPPRGTEEEEREAMARAYQFNHQRARETLQRGKPVIVSATYSRAIYHEQLRSLSRETGCRILFFLLEAPDDVIQKRFESRQPSGFSNIVKFDQYREIRDRYETYPGEILRINTAQPIDTCVNAVLEHLKNAVPATS